MWWCNDCFYSNHNAGNNAVTAYNTQSSQVNVSKCLPSCETLKSANTHIFTATTLIIRITSNSTEALQKLDLMLISLPQIKWSEMRLTLLAVRSDFFLQASRPLALTFYYSLTNTVTEVLTTTAFLAQPYHTFCNLHGMWILQDCKYSTIKYLMFQFRH